MSAETSKSVVKRFIDDVLNGYNIGRAAELCTPDVALFHPAIPIPIRGLGALNQSLTIMETTFPDRQFTTLDMVAEDDMVLDRFRVTGTQKGPFGSLPPTNKRFDGTGMAIYRVVDGKIAQIMLQEDLLKMLQQLGVAPSNLGGGGPRP
jgi:predicted ester cyclase